MSPRSAWVATPLHLRSLARASTALANCGLVIASTMPLAPGVAEQAEALVHAPILEDLRLDGDRRSGDAP